MKIAYNNNNRIEIIICTKRGEEMEELQKLQIENAKFQNRYYKKVEDALDVALKKEDSAMVAALAELLKAVQKHYLLMTE